MITANLSSVETFVHLIRRRAEEQGDQVAFSFIDHLGEKSQTLSYKELEEQARAIAANIGQYAGEPVLLLFPPGPQLIVSFFGCLFAGAIAVPAKPPNPTRLHRSDPRLSAIVKDSRASVALTTQKVAAVEGDSKDPSSPLHGLKLKILDQLMAQQEHYLPPPLKLTSLAMIQYTSGSTATPRGVLLTHANLLATQRHLQTWLASTRADRFLSWLPPNHDMGLIGAILHPLFLGARSWLMNPLDFSRRPMSWLENISRYNATISGAPNFAYALCNRRVRSGDLDRLDLKHWRVAFNGAETIQAHTLETFADTFAAAGFEKSALTPCYGLAEATLFVSGESIDQEPRYMQVGLESLGQGLVAPPQDGEAERLLVSHGKANLDLCIVDPETRQFLGQGRVGEIWLRGDSLSQGYHHRPGESQVTFQACHEQNPDQSWLRTGDLGFLKDDCLFISGRFKELIIMNGRNHFPQDLEWTAESALTGMTGGRGAAFSIQHKEQEALVLFWELPPRSDADPLVVIDTIREAIAEEHGIAPHDILVLEFGALPRTTSGKLRRRECAEQYRKGQVVALAQSLEQNPPEPVTQQQTELARTLAAVPTQFHRHHLLTDYLGQIVGNLLNLDPNALQDQNQLLKLGLDSLSAMELSHQIQVDLGCTLSIENFLGNCSFSTLANTLLQTWLERDNLTPPGPWHSPLGRHPLSFNQRRMWKLSSARGNRGAHNIAHAALLPASTDREALHGALKLWQDRHAMLRTTLGTHEGQPFQQVHRNQELLLEEIDGRHWSPDELREHLADEAHHPLGEGPLIRLLLFELARDESVLLMVADRVALDYWSMALLLHELGVAYRALRKGLEPDLPPRQLNYTDYAHWQEQMLSGPQGERLWQFWARTLDDLPTHLNLPTDRPRRGSGIDRGGVFDFDLPPDLVWRLETIAHDNQCTLFTVLMAAWKFLLHRYSGQNQMVVGTLSSGRTHANLKNLVGPLANPLPIRSDLHGNPRFNDFLLQVREATTEALAHQDFPYSLMVAQCFPNQPSARLFNTMFLFQGSPPYGDAGVSSFALGSEESTVNVEGLEITSVLFEQRLARCDLSLIIAETQQAGFLQASYEYNADLFDLTTVMRMASHFQNLLEAIADDPALHDDEWHLLGHAEREQLLRQSLPRKRIRKRRICLHKSIEKRAARHPTTTALVFQEQEISFEALNRRANQVARFLRHEGVRSEVPVGLSCDRGITMVVAMLAILKAGGIMVPLPASGSSEQRVGMARSAGCQWVLTRRYLAYAFHGSGLSLLDLDDRDRLQSSSHENLDIHVTSSSLACLRYRGQEQGLHRWAQICHGNLTQLPAAIASHLVLENRDASVAPVWCAMTDMVQHGSLSEVLLPLALGFKVIIAQGLVNPDIIQLQTMNHLDREMAFSLAFKPSDQIDADHALLKGLCHFGDRNHCHGLWLLAPTHPDHPNPLPYGTLAATHSQKLAIYGGYGSVEDAQIQRDWELVNQISQGRLRRGTTQPLDPKAPLEKVPFLMVSRDPEAYRKAGEIGHHLVITSDGHPMPHLSEWIASYRQTFLARKHRHEARVTMILPSFIYHHQTQQALEPLSKAFRRYLQVCGMERSEARQRVSELLDQGDATIALIGSPRQCGHLIDQLKGIGVNEVAALVLPEMDNALVLKHLPHLLYLQHRLGHRRPALGYALPQQLQRHRVTHLLCPTSEIKSCLGNEADTQITAGLSHILLNGEHPKGTLIEELNALKQMGPGIHYIYGFAETATAGLMYDVIPGTDERDLGNPLANTHCYILGPDFVPCSPGQEGQLVLGGDSVSRGYRQQPGLTALRFVPDPFGDEVGGRLFLTHIPAVRIKDDSGQTHIRLR